MKIHLGNKISRILTRKNTAVMLPAAILVVLCFLLSKEITIQRMANAQVVANPFVLQTEIYSFQDNPDGELVARKTAARRSDGSSVLVQSVGPIVWGQSGRRIFYIDGASVSVFDSLKTKTTWPSVPKEELASFKAQFLQPLSNCVRVGQTFLGFGKLSGQDVAIVRSASFASTEGEAEQVTYRRAPSLACQTLEYTVEHKEAAGSWRLLTKGKVVSLLLEEPDAGLFDVPSNYTEVRPSEVQRRLFEKVGLPEDAEDRKQIELRDKLYSRK